MKSAIAQKVVCVILLLHCLAAREVAAEVTPVTDRSGAWRLVMPAEWVVKELDPATMVSSPDERANVVVYAEAVRPGSVDEWFDAMLPVIKEHLEGLIFLGRQPLPVAGLQGLLVRAENVSQGVPMHVDFVLAKGTHHQVMLTCSCPKTDLPFEQANFDHILASLELLQSDQAPVASAAPALGPQPAPSPVPSGTPPPSPVPPPATSATPTTTSAPAPKTAVKPPTVKWENYVSKHLTFTIQKPVGWAVEEEWKESPATLRFTITGPGGLYRVSCTVAQTGEKDAGKLVRSVTADLARQLPSLKPAPAARVKQVGAKTIYLLEGAYTVQGSQRRQFRSLVSGGDGMLLHQRIDAPEGALEPAAPILLQTLANLRVAKNVFPFDEGSTAQAGQKRPEKLPLVPRRLAGGWGGYAAPENWRQTDLGKGRVIASDPSERVFFIAASVDFINPRYANLARVPGVLVAQFMRPHQAFSFACTQQGFGSDFKFQVHDRPDLVQEMRLRFAGGRPCSVEDFLYTFRHKGRPYKGLSMGHCVGDYMDAGYSLGHITVWAPADQFDGWLPTFGKMIGSYELNNERVGAYIAQGLARYYQGIAQLSRQIAANSEQMRRENLQLHMEKGRVSDYTSYLTTRMIMGEYDYLAGASGYVRGDSSGLYTAGGHRITSEPYGESITRGMQEINSRQLFEAVRP
ncbi:MAG: hypothetical protein AB9873_08580 [Syntrophobacteraceae bacterium]